MWQDMVNATLQVSAGAFVWLNVLRLYKDKLVRGVDYRAVAFFSLWGYWNLYYYPFLDQWVSFAGGIFITLTNSIYMIMMIHYLRKEKSNDET